MWLYKQKNVRPMSPLYNINVIRAFFNHQPLLNNDKSKNKVIWQYNCSSHHLILGCSKSRNEKRYSGCHIWKEEGINHAVHNPEFHRYSLQPSITITARVLLLIWGVWCTRLGLVNARELYMPVKMTSNHCPTNIRISCPIHWFVKNPLRVNRRCKVSETWD